MNSRVLVLPILIMLGSTATVSAQTEDARLAAFFQSYLDEMFRLRPLEATRQGDHRFDDRLDDLSPRARVAVIDQIRRTRKELSTRFDFQKLTRSGQIDFEIFRHELDFALWKAENTHPYEEDSRLYNEYVSDSVYFLLTQSTLPKARNVANAASRMKAIPGVLAAAKTNLKNPPRVIVETSIRQNQGAIAFYETGLFELTGDAPGIGELRAATGPVLTSLREYQIFLEKELLPRATGDWRLGRERFARKLELELNAGLTADEVLREAEAEFARVEGEMYVLARQQWGQRLSGQPLPPDDAEGRREAIRRVVTKIGLEHSRPDGLVQDVRASVERLRTFIRKADILRLPEPDRCRVLEMPEFRRGNSTAYLDPAPPLDPNAESVYAVSPPPRHWNERQVKSYFEEYNNRMIDIWSIHEGYPGHYVQLEYGNRHPSLIRRVLSSGVFAEGWAVYTEQMMLDQGYGEGDPALRLMQLKFYLRAVGNAILDHKMHCSGMSDAEALDFLTRRCFQSEGEALGKIVRAKQSSCQLSTYFVGRTAFYRLRQAIQRELGEAFHLGRFHEAALAHGTLPVRYLPEVTRERLRQPR